MAAAFAQIQAGDRLDVRCAGLVPAEKVLPQAAAAMKERGVDIGFLRPDAFNDTLTGWAPEIVVTFPGKNSPPRVEGARQHDWDLSEPDSKDAEAWRKLSGEVEQRVKRLVENIGNA
jgi:protein-tyrosine-phosphatase